MPKKPIAFLRDQSFAKGMNTVDDPKALADGECVELVNALPGYPLRPRKGCAGRKLALPDGVYPMVADSVPPFFAGGNIFVWADNELLYMRADGDELRRVTYVGSRGYTWVTVTEMKDISYAVVDDTLYVRSPNLVSPLPDNPSRYGRSTMVAVDMRSDLNEENANYLARVVPRLVKAEGGAVFPRPGLSYNYNREDAQSLQWMNFFSGRGYAGGTFNFAGLEGIVAYGYAATLVRRFDAAGEESEDWTPGVIETPPIADAVPMMAAKDAIPPWIMESAAFRRESFGASYGAWKSIAYGGGVFVAVRTSNDGLPSAMWSADGKDWTFSQFSTDVLRDADWEDVAYGGAGVFVAVGFGNNGPDSRSIMSSEDGGNTWMAQSIAAYELGAVAYGDGVFIAVGREFDDDVNPARNAVGRSTSNGAGWNFTFPLVATANRPTDVAFGNGVFVVVFGDENVYRSMNGGANWSSLLAPSGGWDKIAYGGGYFVAVESGVESSRVIRSADGRTWNEVFCPSGRWVDIAYGNGVFIAIGETGEMMYSADGGETWAALASTDPAHCIAAGNGNFAALTDSSALTVKRNTVEVATALEMLLQPRSVSDYYGFTHIRIYRTNDHYGELTDGMDMMDADSYLAGAPKFFLIDLPIGRDSNEVWTDVKGLDEPREDDYNTNQIPNSFVFPPVNGHIMYYFRSRLFVMNPRGTVFFSVIPGGDGAGNLALAQTDFAKYALQFDDIGNSRFELDPSDGGESRGIMSLGNDLYFFKSNKIFVLIDGDPANPHRLLTAEVGLEWPNTLCRVEIGGKAGLFFISKRGPELLETGGYLRPFTEFKISALWGAGAARAEERLNQASAAFWNDTVWVAARANYRHIYGYVDSIEGTGAFETEISVVGGNRFDLCFLLPVVIDGVAKAVSVCDVYPSMVGAVDFLADGALVDSYVVPDLPALPETTIFELDLNSVPPNITLVNGSEPNTWAIGTVYLTPNKAVHISNGGGAFGYNPSVASIVHFYIEFTVPERYTSWTNTSTIYYNSTTNHVSYKIVRASEPLPVAGNPYVGEAVPSGTTGRLRWVFTWINDGTETVQCSAAVNDIKITHALIPGVPGSAIAEAYPVKVRSRRLLCGPLERSIAELLKMTVYCAFENARYLYNSQRPITFKTAINSNRYKSEADYAPVAGDGAGREYVNNQWTKEFTAYYSRSSQYVQIPYGQFADAVSVAARGFVMRVYAPGSPDVGFEAEAYRYTEQRQEWYRLFFNAVVGGDADSVPDGDVLVRFLPKPLMRTNVAFYPEADFMGEFFEYEIERTASTDFKLYGTELEVIQRPNVNSDDLVVGSPVKNIWGGDA